MSKKHIYTLLIFLLIWTSPINSELRVKDSGIQKMMRGDVGMVFFIKIENISNKLYQLDVKMVQCLEIYPDNEYDTESMYLIGGYMGTISYKSEKTVTLIYPNMYLYNRKGICTVGIYYTDQKHVIRELQTHVKFSTVPKDGRAPEEVKDFYRNKKIKHCDSVDLDPLGKCQPVDCMMKYLGAKSYFHETSKRCQKVPPCFSNSAEDDSDTAYIPTSNRCRSLSSCVTEADLNLIEQGIISDDSKEAMATLGLIFICYHGKVDKSTGLCMCDEGWKSADVDMDKYLPGLSHYHMCNIEVDSWNAANRAKIRNTILAFTILAVVITMLVLMITFCLYALQVYLKDYEGISPFESDDEDVVCTGTCQR